MNKIFRLSHKKGVQTVDRFNFEVHVIVLLNSRFYITTDDGIVIFGFANIFKNAFVAYFTSSDYDAAQVKHNFAQQLFLYYAKYIRFCSRIHYYLLQQI